MMFLLWMASPFLGIAAGLLAFYAGIPLALSPYGYMAAGAAWFIAVFADGYSDQSRWADRLMSLSTFLYGLATFLIVASVTRAIAVDPADWWNICLKDWAYTLLPMAIVAIIALFCVLGAVRPAGMRSGRKVPLTPFLDRK